MNKKEELKIAAKLKRRGKITQKRFNKLKRRKPKKCRFI